MKYLYHICKAPLALVLVAWTVSVQAVGTDAGTTVTNAVDLDYTVGGINQDNILTSVAFDVDRALSVLVQTQDADVVNVIPGQTYTGNDGVPALNFDVTNNSNDDVDLLLGIVDQDATFVTGFAGNAGPGSFDGTGLILVIDLNANGLFDDSTETALTAVGNYFHLPVGSITRDVATRILLVVDVGGTETIDDQATYTLVAAVSTGTSVIQFDTNGNQSPGGSGGTDVADTLLEQDLFADTAGVDSEDLQYNFVLGAEILTQNAVSLGQHSDTSAFVVDTAQLDVVKLVEVLWDPINGNKYDANNSDTTTGNNPKAIPGSLLMYTVGVENAAASSFTVTNVLVDDDLAETLDEGDTTGATVFVPDNVTITLNGSPVVFDIPDSPNLDNITVLDCTAAVSSTAMPATDPEVDDADLGDCDAGDNGLVVYFVTLQ